MRKVSDVIAELVRAALVRLRQLRIRTVSQALSIRARSSYLLREFIEAARSKKATAQRGLEYIKNINALITFGSLLIVVVAGVGAWLGVSSHKGSQEPDEQFLPLHMWLDVSGRTLRIDTEHETLDASAGGATAASWSPLEAALREPFTVATRRMLPKFFEDADPFVQDAITYSIVQFFATRAVDWRMKSKFVQYDGKTTLFQVQKTHLDPNDCTVIGEDDMQSKLRAARNRLSDVALVTAAGPFCLPKGSTFSVEPSRVMISSPGLEVEFAVQDPSSKTTSRDVIEYRLSVRRTITTRNSDLEYQRWAKWVITCSTDWLEGGNGRNCKDS